MKRVLDVLFCQPTGYVTIVNKKTWHLPSSVVDHGWWGQILLANQCAKHVLTQQIVRHCALAFIDTDEYLVPVTSDGTATTVIAALDSLASLATAASPALGLSLRRHNFGQAACAGSGISGAALLSCATQRGPFPEPGKHGLGVKHNLPSNPKWILHLPRLRAWIDHAWARRAAADDVEALTSAGEESEATAKSLPMDTDLLIVNQHHAYEATACSKCIKQIQEQAPHAHWHTVCVRKDLAAQCSWQRCSAHFSHAPCLYPHS